MTLPEPSPLPAPSARTAWRAFAIVAAALLAIKLLALIVLRDPPLLGDEGTYWDWSKRYLDTYWTKDEWWSPLQFVFLDLVQRAFPVHGLIAARALQLLVQTATGAFVMGLGRELEDHRVGLAAGLLYLALPEPVSFAYLLFSETWAAFWFAAAALLYFRSLRRLDLGGDLGQALVGLAFALTVLFRAVYFYFLPLWLLHYWLSSSRPRLNKIISVLLFLAAFAGPVSIHALKNYRLFGEFVPLNTNTWLNFWYAHNTFEPPDHNFYGPYLESLRQGFPGARPETKIAGPASKQRAEMKNALWFIAMHPGLTARRTLRKVEDLFHPSLYIYRNWYVMPKGSFVRERLARPWPLALISTTYVAMTLLATAGLVFSREGRVRSFALMLIGYQLALAAFFFGPTRFRMAFVPALVIFMGWAVVNIREMWRQKFSWRGAFVAVLWAVMLADWSKLTWELIQRYRHG